MNTRHKMERRMNLRSPLRLRAVIRYRDTGGNYRLTATTRNLSFEGAFLETGEIAHLQGSIVRLELHVSPEDPLIIDALVVNSRGDGLGLMFAYYNHEAFERLASLLESTANKPDGRSGSAPGIPEADTALAAEAAQDSNAVP